jgi:AcrR family transcriptional regulator
MKTKVKRAYSSELRRTRARATRRAIVSAATELFVRNGYVVTSIDEIAQRAGVGRATVFTIGGKAELLKLAQDFAVGGDDQDVRLVDRPKSREVRASKDARTYFRRYAALVSEIQPRVAPIHEVIRAAAHADPDVAILWKSVNAARRRGADTIVADVTALAPLRAGLDRRRAADLVWLLNDPVQYHLLVQESGWSVKRYEGWLAGALERELLKAKRHS